MYFIIRKRMLEVCFSAHPNIQYRTELKKDTKAVSFFIYAGNDRNRVLKLR